MPIGIGIRCISKALELPAVLISYEGKEVLDFASDFSFSGRSTPVDVVASGLHLRGYFTIGPGQGSCRLFRFQKLDSPGI
jgi:hypothetical protein